MLLSNTILYNQGRLGLIRAIFRLKRTRVSEITRAASTIQSSESILRLSRRPPASRERPFVRF